MKRMEGPTVWIEGDVALRFARINPSQVEIKYNGYNPLCIRKSDLPKLKLLLDTFLQEYPVENTDKKEGK